MKAKKEEGIGGAVRGPPSRFIHQRVRARREARKEDIEEEPGIRSIIEAPKIPFAKVIAALTRRG